MEENRNSSFWDLLIWVTVLGAGTFALEGLCIHFIGKGWVRIVFFLLGLLILIRESIVERRKPERDGKVGALTLVEATKIVSLAMSLFPLVFLPDGSAIPLDAFLGSLSDFRSEVDADEDAIGCYGLPHDGPRPDFPQVFVCNKEGESRPFDFNPSTVPISAAVPV